MRHDKEESLSFIPFGATNPHQLLGLVAPKGINDIPFGGPSFKKGHIPPTRFPEDPKIIK